jgi:hypothetical protein
MALSLTIKTFEPSQRAEVEKKIVAQQKFYYLISTKLCDIFFALFSERKRRSFFSGERRRKQNLALLSYLFLLFCEIEYF